MAKKIMIVDDEKENRDTMVSLLESNGYEVIPAKDADDCMTKLSLSPALILMDIMMPGTPVKEIVPKIKEIDIVYLSVLHMDDEDKKQILEQDNVIDFIQKPFDMDELVRKIRNILD